MAAEILFDGFDALKELALDLRGNSFGGSTNLMATMTKASPLSLSAHISKISEHADVYVGSSSIRPRAPRR